MLVELDLNMKLPATLALVSALAGTAGASGLTGITYFPYSPYCAMTCLRSFSSLMLSCSRMVGMDVSTSTECWASNTPYLTSVAYCISIKCADGDYLASTLEAFWEENITGQSSDGVFTVPAKWTYQQSLENIASPPTMDLNVTSLVAPATYQSQYNTLTTVQYETTTEYQFGQDSPSRIYVGCASH